MPGWLNTRYSSHNTWAEPLAQGGSEDSTAQLSCIWQGRLSGQQPVGWGVVSAR